MYWSTLYLAHDLDLLKMCGKYVRWSLWPTFFSVKFLSTTNDQISDNGQSSDIAVQEFDTF
jgi:hypothetical protein